jgi:hypothetical protein
MADTTNGSEGAADAGGALGGGRAGSAEGGAGGAAAGAGGATTTTAPGAVPGAPAGSPGAPPPGAGDGTGPPVTGEDRAGAPGQGAGDASGAALGPRPASQSSGAVRSPLLLFAGLGMVFAAGVILAVRNRHQAAGRAGSPGQPGP